MILKDVDSHGVRKPILSKYKSQQMVVLQEVYNCPLGGTRRVGGLLGVAGRLKMVTHRLRQ